MCLPWLLLFFLSLLAVTLDPFFFYVLMINDKDKCLKLDKKLGITAIVFRTFMDIVHSFFWLLCYGGQFRGLLKKFGCSRLPESATDDKSEMVTRRRLVTEVASVLPLTQVSRCSYYVFLTMSMLLLIHVLVNKFLFSFTSLFSFLFLAHQTGARSLLYAFKSF